MPNKNLSAHFDKMVEMRKQGQTTAQIAAHFDVTRQAISLIFKLKGLQLRPKIPDEDIKRLGTPEAVAKEYGINYWTADTRLKKIGILTPHRIYRKWTKEATQPLYDDYIKGLSTREVGEKYGVEQSVVAQIFRKHGFTSRGQGWPKGKPRKV